MYFATNFIKTIIKEAVISGKELLPTAKFCLDTRTLEPGDIFIACQGTTVDGHEFIQEALKNGAAGIMANNAQETILNRLDKKLIAEKTIILVPDTREALVTLATAWREKFTCPIIGITGSIGKTTTKEMLSNILKINNKNALISKDNQNTALGISLNMLRLNSTHDVAIFEMGISKRGEMARMAAIVKPTTAIITYIGHSHMEGLGSINDIAHEKRDIFKYFKEDNIGIVNGDQQILTQVSYTHPTIKFGCKTTNQIQARKIQSTHERTTFLIKFYKERHKVSLQTSNAGIVFNALAAATAAHLLNIPTVKIVEGIQMPIIIARRFESKPLKNNHGILIDDSYNANPESMKAALLALEKLDAKGAKIAVLGDMLELGVNSPFWHRQLGRFLRKVPSLSHVILVGDMVKWTKATIPMGLTVDITPTWENAVDKITSLLKPDSVVLIKGSQGMNLSNLAQKLV